MPKLYEIVKEIENFELQIDDETGEITNADELDALELEKETKIENICLWIKNLRADAEAYKAEENNFKARRQAAEKKADKLQGYIQHILTGEKFKTTRVSVSYRKSTAVECPDISLVDDDYLTYKAPELNKTKIKEAIKAGIKVKGCFIAERQNISIK